MAQASAHSKWVWVSVTMNLGMLGVFKYYNFFAQSASELLLWLGLPSSDLSLSIVLPVGISFYTFQTLSYSIDIHRGKLSPCRSLSDFALFVAFFPQLVAGPIERASNFLPQLSKARRLEDVDFRGASLLFLLGFIKKGVIADNLAFWVDQVYASASTYDALSIRTTQAQDLC